MPGVFAIRIALCSCHIRAGDCAMLIQYLLAKNPISIPTGGVYVTVDGPVFYACVLLTVVVSIVLHELAHGWAAIWQGDDTPRVTGHMTADPLTHMGGASLVMLALVGIAWGMMPVNPARFRSRHGDAMVSAAGPFMNIVLALLGLVVLLVWRKLGNPPTDGWAGKLQVFLFVMGQYNIVLAMLNMVPVPPLDGSTVLRSFVPAYGRMLDRIPNPEMLFFMFFIVLMMAPPQYNLFVVASRIAGTILNLGG